MYRSPWLLSATPLGSDNLSIVLTGCVSTVGGCCTKSLNGLPLISLPLTFTWSLCCPRTTGVYEIWYLEGFLLTTVASVTEPSASETTSTVMFCSVILGREEGYVTLTENWLAALTEAFSIPDPLTLYENRLMRS